MVTDKQRSILRAYLNVIYSFIWNGIQLLIQVHRKQYDLDTFCHINNWLCLLSTMPYIKHSVAEIGHWCETCIRTILAGNGKAHCVVISSAAVQLEKKGSLRSMTVDRKCLRRKQCQDMLIYSNIFLQFNTLIPFTSEYICAYNKLIISNFINLKKVYPYLTHSRRVY